MAINMGHPDRWIPRSADRFGVRSTSVARYQSPSPAILTKSARTGVAYRTDSLDLVDENLRTCVAADLDLLLERRLVLMLERDLDA